jgi:hypothetical protein
VVGLCDATLSCNDHWTTSCAKPARFSDAFA